MGRKILAVDNSPVVLRLLTHHLQNQGHEVKTAEDGLAALEILESYKPDIMIVDLVMPMISGDRLCRIIRKIPEFDNVFIVILSAIAAEEEIDFISLGADACIAKGPSPEMMNHIHKVVDQSGKSDRTALSGQVLGLDGLYEREITKELLATKKDFERSGSYRTDVLDGR